MKKEKELLKAIGDIDEKYILEAMPKATAQEDNADNISTGAPNEIPAGSSSLKDRSPEEHYSAENRPENDKVIHITNKRHFKPIGTIAAAIIIVLGFSAYMTVFNGNKEVLAPQAVMDASSAEAITGNEVSEDGLSDDETEEESMIMKSTKLPQQDGITSDVSPAAQAKTGFAPEASPENGLSKNALSEENTARDTVKTEGVGAAPEEKKEIITMIANPWHDSSTLSEAEADAGFDMIIPESFLNCKAEIFRSMTNKMLEIIYCDTTSHEVFRARKSITKDSDISGDYNSYENERTVSIDGTAVTLKGTGDDVYVAIWTKGDYSYAIDIDSEQSIVESDILELVKQIS